MSTDFTLLAQSCPRALISDELYPESTGVPPVQARLIARRLVLEGWLEPIGEKRGRRYVRSERIIQPS